MLRIFYSWLPIQYLLISQSPAIWFNSAASDRYEIISYAWFRLWSIEQLTKTVILDDTVRPDLFANEVWNGSCDSHCVGERSTSDTLHRLSFLSCPPRFVFYLVAAYFSEIQNISTLLIYSTEGSKHPYLLGWLPLSDWKEACLDKNEDTYMSWEFLFVA